MATVVAGIGSQPFPLLAADNIPTTPKILKDGTLGAASYYPDQMNIIWTPANVRETLLISNQILDGLISSSQFVPLDSKIKEQKELLEQYNSLARKMRIPAPALYVDQVGIAGLGLGMVPAALSNITQEGTQYICISPGFFHTWNLKQQISVLSQELAQYKEGYLTPDNIALMLNDPAKALAAKFRADAVGTGPEGTGHPEDLASALAKMYESYKTEYLARHPTKTTKDFEQYYAEHNRVHRPNMLAHPPIEERIKALSMSKNVPGSFSNTIVSSAQR